jgi:hypothetical protein
MFAVEIYAAVRRFVFIEGNSRREAARFRAIETKECFNGGDRGIAGAKQRTRRTRVDHLVSQ